jgi:hypothetical protein
MEQGSEGTERGERIEVKREEKGWGGGGGERDVEDRSLEAAVKG